MLHNQGNFKKKVVSFTECDWCYSLALSPFVNHNFSKAGIFKAQSGRPGVIALNKILL